jgi:hypothetical protein
MHYFALLLGPESTEEADAATQAEIMTAYQNFHIKAGHAIRAGDALLPSETGVRITGGPTHPVVTDGPFAEGAEVAGGYYVFEADNLDDALELAKGIPACQSGAVELWPMADAMLQDGPLQGSNWLALLLEPPGNTPTPGTPEWDAGAAAHGEFIAAAGEHIKSGGGLHPPSTATTVQVRDGKVTLTDGPYIEGAEVANGFYILAAADRDEAVKIASMIPATTVALRPLAGVSAS